MVEVNIAPCFTRFFTALIMCSILASASVGFAQRDHEDVKTALGFYFKSMEVRGNQLKLIRNPVGGNMVSKVGSKEGEISIPGSKIDVPLGMDFTLFERHSGIKFEPLPAPMVTSGYQITKYFDARSFGETLTLVKGIMIFVNAGDQKTVMVIGPDINEAKRLLGM